ncbi:TPA: EamA family transporter [Stenotrophomonas maltophilia]|uniref:EamA family transporter n=1 Tax=Stenotrophomonas TaxID=40323 RepID=UPI0013DC8C87|nr:MULTISPECIES: EamA family transporter [Stenotrophomonas]MBH1593345.1 EamA family transporter [Stenotrophomonas maltophilia]MDH2024831.1 EamA family transporter [Stenotrophomonas sp. GD03680]HEL3751184.1 EamA family transporter [Stenotrophomonas maltophilia]HEL7731763.1 EamA family transporter [Stenotrophomonas maltophilia]
MQTSRFAPMLPALAVLGSVTALSVGTSYAKHLFPLIGAQGTSALRVGFSALLLLLFWRPWRWKTRRADAITILRYGLTLGLMNLLFYMAIRTIPFGIAVAIEFTGPLTVAMLSSRRPIDFLWMGCAVVGLLLLLPLGGAAALDPVGVLYALGAAACWGLYIVFGKRAGHLHAGHSVSLGLLAASLVVVPVGVIHAGAALLDPKILLAGLLVALVSSAIPMSLEMMALKRLPKETFGILISMEPAVAALWAMLLLHEHLHGLQWLAIGCTVVASVGSTMTARRSKAPAMQAG